MFVLATTGVTEKRHHNILYAIDTHWLNCSPECFHTVEIIRFKIGEHKARLPREKQESHQRKVSKGSLRTTNPFSEILLFGKHETGFL